MIDEMEPTGAPVFGWPLVWSVPAFPLRVVGGLDPDSAFVVALLLSLVANAVAVLATAYVGLFATGRRSVGLGAAALFAAWPLLSRPLAGTSAWENGQWHADVGLHLYTEPLSTALVATVLAVLLRNWTESLIFTPRTLVVLLPLLLLGMLALRRGAAIVLLGGWILVTAAFYSFYDATSDHPRFLYAALPALFVFEAAGARLVVVEIPRRLRVFQGRAVRSS